MKNTILYCCGTAQKPKEQIVAMPLRMHNDGMVFITKSGRKIKTNNYYRLRNG